MTHVYCSECGFQNPETANYCSRCGALLEKSEAGSETQTFTPDEVGELANEPVEGLEGPALVVRSGGGRAGETFRPAGERTRIGRSPSPSPGTTPCSSSSTGSSSSRTRAR